jgi:hypothetical protein
MRVATDSVEHPDQPWHLTIDDAAGRAARDECHAARSALPGAWLPHASTGAYRPLATDSALPLRAITGNGPGKGLALPMSAYRVEALDEAVDE